MYDVSLLSLAIIKKIVHLVSCLVFLSLLLRSLYDSYSKPFKFSVQIYVKALNFSKGMRFKRLFPMLLAAYTHLPNAKVLLGRFFRLFTSNFNDSTPTHDYGISYLFFNFDEEKKYTSHSLVCFFYAKIKSKCDAF